MRAGVAMKAARSSNTSDLSTGNIGFGTVTRIRRAVLHARYLWAHPLPAAASGFMRAGL